MLVFEEGELVVTLAGIKHLSTAEPCSPPISPSSQRIYLSGQEDEAEEGLDELKTFSQLCVH